jgi:hypothetical protein
VSRADATKAALEAIHKPHSNPHDRYTYLMMPAPLHMTQIQHHHYGFGPKHDHHSHSDSHAGSHTGSNVASANVSLSGEQQDDLLPGPHTAQYTRALSPDSLRAHNEQQQAHHHHHHGKELHIPHHEKDFYVSTAPLHTPDEKYHHNHHSEPSHFSETMHSHHHGEGRNTHSPSNMTVSSMGSATLTLPHIPGTGSRSRGTSPNAAQQAAHKDFNASTAQESTIVTQSSAAGSAPGSAEKRPRSNKGSNKSPFANKDKYRGPQRRVLDIIEWARVSVGGPPKKQNRKMSEVEKRLLKRLVLIKLLLFLCATVRLINIIPCISFAVQSACSEVDHRRSDQRGLPDPRAGLQAVVEGESLFYEGTCSANAAILLSYMLILVSVWMLWE